MYTAHVACVIKIAEYRRIDKTTECQKTSIRPEHGKNRHIIGVASHSSMISASTVSSSNVGMALAIMAASAFGCQWV